MQSDDHIVPFCRALGRRGTEVPGNLLIYPRPSEGFCGWWKEERVTADSVPQRASSYALFL